MKKNKIQFLDISEEERLPFHRSIYKANDKKFIKLIEKYNVDINSIIDDEKNNFLIEAVNCDKKGSENQMTIIHYLIKNGIDINHKCKDGYNAFDISIEWSELSKISLLLVKDKNANFYKNKNIVYKAIRAYSDTWRKEYKEAHETLFKVVETLLQKNANLEGCYSWLEIIEKDYPELLELFEKYGHTIASLKAQEVVEKAIDTNIDIVTLHQTTHKNNYDKTAKVIWKKLVPKSGQADTVQGEILRAIEKLRDEAQRNGNVNFNKKCHLILIHFIGDYLLDENVFDKPTLKQIKSDLKKLSKKTMPYTEDDVYDRLTNLFIGIYKIQNKLVRLLMTNYIAKTTMLQKIHKIEDLETLEKELLKNKSPQLIDDLYSELLKNVDYKNVSQWNKAVRICESLTILGWGNYEALQANGGSFFNGNPETIFYNAFSEKRFVDAIWSKRKNGYTMEQGRTSYFKSPQINKPIVLWDYPVQEDIQDVKPKNQRNWIPKNPIIIGRFISNCYENSKQLAEDIETELKTLLDTQMQPKKYGKAINVLRIFLSFSYSDPGVTTNYIIADDKLKLKKRDFNTELKKMFSKEEIRNNKYYLRNRFEIGPFSTKTGKQKMHIYLEKEFSELSYQEQKKQISTYIIQLVETSVNKLKKKKLDYNFDLMLSDFTNALNKWNKN